MNDKKRELLYVGARVRVADDRREGAERWLHARHGTVQAMTNRSERVQVLLDGDPQAGFVDWRDLDVEEKPRPTWLDVPIRAIRPSRWQYRRRFDQEAMLELAASIRDVGLINRLLVFRDEDNAHYELISGERRLRACCALAMHKLGDFRSLAEAVGKVAASGPDWVAFLENVPDTFAVACELWHGGPAEFREIVILENLQRADPTPVEEAEAFRLLIAEEGYTQDSLAKRISKSQGYVSQRLGLLGLAEAVREAVGTEISFTAARSIATLPAGAQGAVTEEVRRMMAREGESAASTRKVQAMVSQMRRFLEPAHWDPPADEVIRPETRNRLRLLRHAVEHITPEEMGEALLRLRSQAGTISENYVGRSAALIAEGAWETNKVLGLLDGSGRASYGDHDWPAVARAHGWTCESCVLREARRPSARLGEFGCTRWDAKRGAGEQIVSCIRYIGPGDPVVLPLASDVVSRVKDVELPDGMGKARWGSYVEDAETFAMLEEHAAARKAQEEEARTVQKQTGHLVPLRQYWAAQQEGSGFDTAHAQAHACRRCANCAPRSEEELAADLPPCRYAMEPLKQQWTEQTVAPDMGVLVDAAGRMVPRCAGFRAREMPAIAPSRGFRFPGDKAGRRLVGEWFQRLATSAGNNGHGDTLPRILSWLPVTAGAEEGQDLDAMASFIVRHWEELGGDEAVATLLSVVVVEAKARGRYEGTFDLMNPATREIETWRGVEWERVALGKAPGAYDAWPAPGAYDAWPEGWPRPWVGRPLRA